MRKLKKIKLMIGFWIGFINMIYSQDNILVIKDGKGEIGTGGNIVNIKLVNKDLLGGFQFSLN